MFNFLALSTAISDLLSLNFFIRDLLGFAFIIQLSVPSICGRANPYHTSPSSIGQTASCSEDGLPWFTIIRLSADKMCCSRHQTMTDRTACAFLPGINRCPPMMPLSAYPPCFPVTVWKHILRPQPVVSFIIPTACYPRCSGFQIIVSCKDF